MSDVRVDRTLYRRAVELWRPISAVDSIDLTAFEGLKRIRRHGDALIRTDRRGQRGAFAGTGTEMPSSAATTRVRVREQLAGYVSEMQVLFPEMGLSTRQAVDALLLAGLAELEEARAMSDERWVEVVCGDGPHAGAVFLVDFDEPEVRVLLGGVVVGCYRPAGIPGSPEVWLYEKEEA